MLPADRWDMPPRAWKLHQAPKFDIFPLSLLITPVDFDHHKENFEFFLDCRKTSLSHALEITLYPRKTIQFLGSAAKMSEFC